MRWREALNPVTMQRVALLAPRTALRDLLVAVADQGTVEVDDLTDPDPTAASLPAAARLRGLPAEAATTRAAVSATPPDLDAIAREGRVDLLAGEAELEARAAAAVQRDAVAGLTGWMPGDAVTDLANRVAAFGGAVVPLARPLGVQPPTAPPRTGAAREFAPLVDTYATVPYSDLNPALLAGLAYVVMFGMMFADVGDGALLVLTAVAVRWRWWSRLERLRPVWLFLLGAGLASMAFGALYGEFFGPTRVVPVLWLAPLDHPVTLLLAAVGVGGVLLAGAYGLGSVNRYREGGWRAAAYSPSGLAGAALFLGLAVLVAGVYYHLLGLLGAGAAIVAAGLAVAFLGLFAAAGGRGAGAAQAAIELFDLVLRLGSNLVSFARLAAFGLTHAALAQVVWTGTVGLWRHGPAGVVAALLLFVLGSALTFALEGLVAGVQALRLEYYELFSRVFDAEGRPFRPWHIPLAVEASC